MYDFNNPITFSEDEWKLFEHRAIRADDISRATYIAELTVIKLCHKWIDSKPTITICDREELHIFTDIFIHSTYVNTAHHASDWQVANKIAASIERKLLACDIVIRIPRS